jgi:hypothetical protein
MSEANRIGRVFFYQHPVHSVYVETKSVKSFSRSYIPSISIAPVVRI